MQSFKYTYLRRLLRRRSTRSERIIWPYLREFRSKGYPIRRQYSINPYIVDFYCAKAKLAIEIDGSIHDTDSQKEYDKEREIYINSKDVEVIRFTNDQVDSDIDSVLQAIEQKILSNLNSHQEF